MDRDAVCPCRGAQLVKEASPACCGRVTPWLLPGAPALTCTGRSCDACPQRSPQGLGLGLALVLRLYHPGGALLILAEGQAPAAPGHEESRAPAHTPAIHGPHSVPVAR